MGLPLPRITCFGARGAAPAHPRQRFWRCEAPSAPTGPTSGRRTTRRSRPESSDSDKHRAPLPVPPSRHGYGCWSQSTSMAPSRPSSSTLCKLGRCPQGFEALRAAAALGGVIAAIVSRRDLATLAATSASNPTTSAQPLCVRSAVQPGSVDPHRQRWSTQTAHHSAEESQNQAAPSPRAHERMTPQSAGSRHWHGQEALVAAGWVQPMPAGPPRMRIP
jgi:hypothetical protein